MARDEYHVAKGMTTQITSYFRMAQTESDNQSPTFFADSHKGRPFKIAITGTPFEGTPTDLRGHLSVIEEQSWSSPGAELRHCTNAKLTEIGKLYQSIINLKTKSDADSKGPEIQRLLQLY